MIIHKGGERMKSGIIRETMKVHTYENVQTAKLQGTLFIRWVMFAVIVGTFVGAFSSLFGVAMEMATEIRTQNEVLILFLPFAGFVIVSLYRWFGIDKDSGTNLVIDTVHKDGVVPVRVAPLIFITTIITHLFGGSAGREGAALQIGGSLSDFIARKLHLDLMDRKVLILCGMSAAFAALFGTPMAATIFSMEVVTVGVMYYVALLPCAVSALVASLFASKIAGITPESFTLLDLPSWNPKNIAIVLFIAVIGACVSSLFCSLLHRTSHLLEHYVKSPYARIFLCGACVVIITICLGTTDYNGAGIDVMKRAFEGDVVPYAFVIKMLLTALTLGGGYKGGEIVPTFFVGATLGAWIGSLFGISTSFCAGIGMAVLFCGVTNCPITTLIISFELFQYKAVPFFLFAIAVSYVVSGYSGLYGEQKIMYSKYKAMYINRNVKDE